MSLPGAPKMTEIFAGAQPRLKSERLILRPYTVDDAAAFQMLANHPSISATTTFPYPMTIEFAEQLLAKSPARWTNGEAAQFAVVIESTGEMIGGVLLFGFVGAHAKAELGYWMGTSYWAKGYMTEACRALLKYGFEVLELNRVFAKIVPSNIASVRVVEKLGFTREGLLREDSRKSDVFLDLEIFGMLRREFKS